MHHSHSLVRSTGPLLAAFLLVLALSNCAHGAGLLVADNGSGGQLQIKEQAVHVTINNGVAVTDVTQVFQNLENRQVEALYTFPVPKGASVANFSMWINGKEMVGEVVEKEQARKIYDSYKQVRRDPGLLEQTDFRTFEMRIFPIAPHGRGEGADHLLPGARFRSRLGDLRLSAGHLHRGLSLLRRPRASSLSTLDVKAEVPIVAMESPSHPKDFAVVKHEPAIGRQASKPRRAT